MNGSRLKEWRVAAGLTQTALAENLGVRPATLSEWESGARAPGRDHAVLLEDATEGAVPLESWSDDPEVAAAMVQNVARRRIDTPVPTEARDSHPGVV